MSLAEETREAARERPFLLAALGSGVVNYTAAARHLGDAVDGDVESVATALRRFAESLPEREVAARDARVSMESGLGRVADAGVEEPLLSVGDTALAPGEGSLTAVVAEADVDASALAHVLRRLTDADVGVEAAGVGDDALVVVVERRDGANAVRVVESAMERVPGPAE